MKNKNQILAATVLVAFFSFSQVKAETKIDLNGTIVSHAPYANHEEYHGALEHIDLEDIVYIEDEEDIDLGFDPKQYLPADFDAFQGMRLDLNDIPYIECEEEVILDFDVKDYLPKDFSPYSAR